MEDGGRRSQIQRRSQQVDVRLPAGCLAYKADLSNRELRQRCPNSYISAELDTLIEELAAGD
jgi:hypothetical protein